MGACEAGAPAPVEASLKYHPCFVETLTSGVEPGGQCQAGSFTGAVTSQNVTEASKGSLKPDGNRL